MKKTIITLVLGTVILFVWNAISWMALPFHSNALKTIPDAVIEGQNLKIALPEDGIYHYPGIPESNAPEDITKIESKMEEGPRITFMAYKTGPTKLFDVNAFALNLIFNFITICLIFWVVKNQSDKSIKKILSTTLALGLLVSFASDFPQMNWFMFPLSYTLPNILDYLVSFGLFGLLMGVYTFKTKAKS